VPISIAILVSGRGSNMKAILEAIQRGELDASVSVVLSNNPSAAALDIAREHNVPALAVPSKGKAREEHEQEVLATLAKYEIDYVVLAGYMRVLTPVFLNAFKGADGNFRVINIHPSLLPDFPGANAYEDAFAAGVTESGITVHLVDEAVDHGPILEQARFPRLPSDTLESFKARGLAVEHQLFPRVLQRIAKECRKEGTR
jgi:phosphoribosylglycinamide formyltransferase 1